MIRIVSSIFMDVVHRFKRVYERYSIDLHTGLKIGPGTDYSLENLDGICPQLITIGRDCVIAPHAVILTHDASLVPSYGKYYFKPVVIGDRVFLGYGVVVMPGVRIGDGAVIGSNAVVTKDIPSNKVAIGAPARVVCDTADLEKKRRDKLIPTPFRNSEKLSRAQILHLQRLAIKSLDCRNAE